MRIVAKEIPVEVKSTAGFIVYLLDENENPLTAEITELDGLEKTIKELKEKHNI